MTKKAIYLESGEIASLLTEEGRFIRNRSMAPSPVDGEYIPRQGPIGEVLNNISSLATSLGITPFGFPGAAAFLGQAMLSNIDTLSHNLRWYFISNFRQHISECYVEYGIVRKAVDVPVDDAYRGKVMIKSSQMDEKELKMLQRVMKESRDLHTCSRTQKWARLFGGAGTLMIVDDQDPIAPFQLSSIKQGQKVEFRAVDLWELFWELQNTEGYSENLALNVVKTFNYYGENVHKSRVFRVNGLEIPSFVRPRFRGWGASILEHIVRPLNQSLKHNDLVFEVIDEFKLDVYMIDGFMQAMADPAGEALMKKRIDYANGRKNFQNATVLDAKDKFEQRQLTFAGLSEILKDNRIALAAELCMPLTKLYGLSATGFNAGEEDLENYNMMVEGTIRPDQEYLVENLAKVRCQQLFGDMPDDLEFEYPSLRVLSSVDESTVKRNKATTLAEIYDRGALTKEEYRDAVNASQLIDLKLDNSPNVIRELEETEMVEEDVDEEAGAEGKPKASDDGGLPKQGQEKVGSKEKPAADRKPGAGKEGLKRHA